MEKQIHLSEKIIRDIAFGKYSHFVAIEFILCVLFILSMMSCIFIGQALDAKNYLYIWVVLGLVGLTGISLLVRWQWGNKLIRRRVLEENAKDWALSQEIKALSTYLKANPPDLKKMNFSGLQEVENIKPIRIEYFPQQELAGEFAGTFRGSWGLFTLGGEVSGSIKGESTPELTDQNMVLICMKEDGDSVRLICPSSHVLRRNLMKYFYRLAEDYGEGSYAYDALQDFWQGPNGLREILEGQNPQRIYDYLVTKLELPLEQRPNISVKGIQLKEGSFLVSLIGCDGKESEVVIPLGLLNEIRTLLEEKLQKSLPPVLLLESKGAS